MATPSVHSSVSTLVSGDRGLGPSSTWTVHDGAREQLLSFLRGTRVVIPDMQVMMSHWPVGTHPEVDKLERDCRGRLATILSHTGDKDRLDKMARSCIGVLGASWWPYASYDALLIATYLCIWLFVWDDETDSSEFSSLIRDFEESCTFRRETISYITDCLSAKPDFEAASSQAQFKLSVNPIINNFWDIGQAISARCHKRQADTLLDELRFFVAMAEEEHEFQATKQLPTIEEYSRRRMGSSAVCVCLAVTEYALGINMPEAIMRSESMRAIWNETNIIISTVNDILSIKKEVDQAQVDTLIPLLSVRLGSVQEAINQAARVVQASVDRLDETAETLLNENRTDPLLSKQIQDYVDACRYACTGNLKWSLVSGRYKLEKEIGSMQGGLTVTL